MASYILSHQARDSKTNLTQQEFNEAILYLLIHKGIIEDIQELKDMADSIKTAKILSE